MYLGTRLSPAAYYQQRATQYENPHADAVGRLLGELIEHLHVGDGVVLDVGCGDGLVTKLLHLTGTKYRRPCLGIDRSPQMIARYRAETGCAGYVMPFDGELPAADIAVAAYSLHLAAPQELVLFWWRLYEAGVQRLIVISPLKARPAAPPHYFHRIEAIRGNYGPQGKTVYGAVYVRD